MITSGAAGRCGVCGQAHAGCGPAVSVAPVDPMTANRRERYTVSELREYRVTLNGVETTAQLSPGDAKRLGGVPVDEPAAAEPAAAKAQAVVPNTARTSAKNKRR